MKGCFDMDVNIEEMLGVFQNQLTLQNANVRITSIEIAIF